MTTTTTILTTPAATTSSRRVIRRLRDSSFRVRPGEAFGILGDPGAGKSTLLGILGGRVHATEGRALVRDPISPLPKAVVSAVSASGKGTRFELVRASRLLGMDTGPIEEHLAEIEELAAPLYTEDGEREPGSLLRISIATAVIVPSNVVLVEEPPGLDQGFMGEVADRLHRGVERLRERFGLATSAVQGLNHRRPGQPRLGGHNRIRRARQSD